MESNYKTLNANEFEQAISNSQVIVVDVRTAKEYASEHIANAINIDMSSPDFIYEATAKLPKSRRIAIYCKSGTRSKMAAILLANKGYNILYLNGGITAWTNAGKNTAH